MSSVLLAAAPSLRPEHTCRSGVSRETPTRRSASLSRRRSTRSRPEVHGADLHTDLAMVEHDVRVPATVGASGKLRYLGRARTKLWLELTAAYNLTRLANLEAAPHSGAARPAEAGIGVARLKLPRPGERTLLFNDLWPSLRSIAQAAVGSQCVRRVG